MGKRLHVSILLIVGLFSLQKKVEAARTAAFTAQAQLTHIAVSLLEATPVVTHDKSFRLPTEFDARTAWSQCSTISGILEQGHCSSCWAFAAVESLSDSFCIQFGTHAVDLCGVVGVTVDIQSLLGGASCTTVLSVVTEECDPYFDDTGFSHPGCEPAYPTSRCFRKCENNNQIRRSLKHYSVSAYKVNSHPQDIMAELYKKGPIEVAFTVYEDFAHYNSGVYKHITGDVMGGHAVKLIGWGTTEDGEDYRLVANQWNKGWGEDGLFKIRRGTSECGFENDPVAGLRSCEDLNIKEFVDSARLLMVSLLHYK